MKHRKQTICLCLMLVASTTTAEVRFVGSRPETRTRLSHRLEQLARTGASQSDQADSAVTWLAADGYLDAQVSSDSAGVIIEAGTRLWLDSVVVEAPLVRSLVVDAPFTAQTLEHAVDRILAEVRQDGHYYATGRMSEFRRAHSHVTAVLRVNPGPPVLVAAIQTDGLNRTDEATIDKLLEVKPGDTLTDKLTARAATSADRISFVDFLPPLEVNPRPGYLEADLLFRFREKRQVRIAGGAGYVPNDPHGLVWNLDLVLRNLLGKGRQVNLKSERREAGRTVLNLRYRQPVFWLGSGNLHLDLATRDYRDQFYEFAVDGRYGADVSSNVDAGLHLAWKRVEPATSEAGFSKYTIGFELGRPVLDDPLNPSSGIEISWQIDYSYRQYTLNSSTSGLERSSLNETRNHVSIKTWYPLLRSLVGYLGVSYAGLETAEELPPLSELTLVGGPGTIRGYRNEQFAAQRTTYGTLESRLRFNAGYLFAFYDGAYMNFPSVENDDVRTVELYRSGFGIGLTLLDNARSLTLSAGWNRRLPFDEPMLSVQIASEF
ncbi:MAG: BamA/TamA family outer membrane protein [Candidatus Zixiibacteriota bacterium]|nr:MAG: BamA/TamA family outer membrane protein [candidate division Zixibacteria bacterium]